MQELIQHYKYFASTVNQNAQTELALIPANSAVTTTEPPTTPTPDYMPIVLEHATEILANTRASVLGALERSNHTRFTTQTTGQVFWQAVMGNLAARQEMRSRWPLGAYVYDSYDPYLTRSLNDSALMAELKMYGRAIITLRDGTIYTLTNLDTAIAELMLLGIDFAGAGLHYYGGMDYNPESRARNMNRIDSMVQLYHACTYITYIQTTVLQPSIAINVLTSIMLQAKFMVVRAHQTREKYHIQH